MLPQIAFLEESLATSGAMTRRKPGGDERRDIDYGERVARVLAGMDLGQTAIVKDRAAVALEAMEGTDEAILRAWSHRGSGNDRGQGVEATAGHAVRRAGRGPRDLGCDARGLGRASWPSTRAARC